MSESPETGLHSWLHRLEWNVQTGVVSFLLPDGRCISTGIAPPAGGDSTTIQTAAFDPAEHTLRITTMRGDEVTMHLEPLYGPARVVDRPVVYLDQLHWSTLARHLYGNGSVAKNDADPADEIIRRARCGEILLPMSAGHAVETVVMYADKRQDLAATLLGLSGGWQMLHPVDVRKREFAAVVASDPVRARFPERSEVFTVSADRMFSGGVPVPNDIEKQYLPAQLLRLTELLSAVMATFDALMDPDPDTAVKPQAWTDQTAAIACDPAFQALPRTRRRDAARGLALRDVTSEFAEISFGYGVAPEQAVERMMASLRGSREQMPFFALWTDVLDERLSSFQTRWESNDLIDMLFLGCAAAYADVVVAERTATNYLNAVWRRRPGKCPVVRTLAEALDRLDEPG
jgi:hypothetical protein